MPDGRTAPPRRSPLARAWPLAAIVALLGVAYAAGLQHDLSFDVLGQRQQRLQALVGSHPLAMGAAYVALYAAAVAISLPASLVITVAGGLIFGAVAGAACAVVGATCGAVLLFLAARHAAGGWLAAHAGPLMAKLRAGLERDGFSYLLAMRLIPVFPFWLVNLAPAVAGMRLLPFAAATFLGIIPGTAVLASVGAGIGSVLAEGRRPDPAVIFRPAVILPLLGLALLSLLPVAWRRMRNRRGGV